MEKLSRMKRGAIVRDYLSGMSYGEISAKHHVSTGAVANVVADLKAGRFPEAGDVGEHIEQLKELSLDLKQANLSPGKCAVGLIVMTRINECGLEPADIDRWPEILKSAGNEDEAREFVRLVYSIQEVQKRTGLNLDALANKVHELEKKAVELKPVSGKLADYKKQLAELSKRQSGLSGEVTSLEEQRKVLNTRVKDLERRKKDFTRRVAELEPRAQQAGVILDTFRKESHRLQNIGLSFKELTEFCQSVQAIAQRQTIKSNELRSRLLHELEILDEGLGLETLIKAKQIELKKAEQAVTSTGIELETIRAVVGSLKQEKTRLEVSIKETRERVSQEIEKIIPVARGTVDRLAKELSSGVGKAIAEVGQLRDQSLEAGKEVGRYQEILEANAWLKEVLALVRGGQDIEAKHVRAIALSVAFGVSGWFKLQDKYSTIFISLSSATNNLIRELEQWKV